MRVIEIAADAGVGHGMWHDVAACQGGGKQFTENLKAKSARYYGTAGRAFVTELIRQRDGLAALWRQRANEFAYDFLPDGAGGQVQRVMSAFALAAFAGEMASRWEIAPWSKNDAICAAGNLFYEWANGRPTLGNSEEAQILTHVRSVMQRNWHAKFMDWPRSMEQKADLSRMANVSDSFGFRKPDLPFVDGQPSYLFYVHKERFDEEFATKGGFKPSRVRELLRKREVLRCDKDCATWREPLPNGDSRSICIIGAKLWALEP